MTEDRVHTLARELREALDPRLDVDRLRPLVVRAGRIARAGAARADLLDALIAATTPPELLDLSLIAPHDTWSGTARAAAERESPTEIAALVRVLG